MHSGHRSVPHTADLRIEAWGRTREECVAQAVLGLVESFADVSGARPGRLAVRRLAGRADADLVAAAVDEVIYLMDADGVVPVRVDARAGRGGGIDLILRLASLDSAEITGAAPKAASLSGLACAPDGAGGWRAAVTVDV